MATDDIRNPLEWGWDQMKAAGRAMSAAGRGFGHADRALHAPLPGVRRIGTADIREALAQGFADYGAYRTDVIFICLVYPVLGLVLARIAYGYELVPFLFPLAAGFALVGPFLAVGLNEMSRRRELGDRVRWSSAFGVLRSPALGQILLLGLVLFAVFMAWLAAAWIIYDATLGAVIGPRPAIGAFLSDVFTTREGWTMIVLGCGIGFLFALAVLVTTVIAFPLLLDRDVGLDTAVMTSIRVVLANPVPMALWGLIVAGGLVLGSLPLFLGLVVVMPVLGHATWHLYRKVVVPPPERAAASASRQGAPAAEAEAR